MPPQRRRLRGLGATRRAGCFLRTAPAQPEDGGREVGVGVAVPATEDLGELRVARELAAEDVVGERPLVPPLRGLELRAGEELCRVSVAEDRESQVRVGRPDG